MIDREKMLTVLDAIFHGFALSASEVETIHDIRTLIRTAPEPGAFKIVNCHFTARAGENPITHQGFYLHGYTILPTEDYQQEATRVKGLVTLLSRVEAEPLASGEPAESVQIGRLQVAAELHAALAEVEKDGGK